MDKALFVLAHGSKAPEADSILEAVVEKVRVKAEEEFSYVGYGSLQISKPSFEEGIEELINKGVKEIVIVPMFIFIGNHVKYDIPELLDMLKEKYSGVSFIMGNPIGADDKLVEIIMSRAIEAKEKQ